MNKTKLKSINRQLKWILLMDANGFRSIFHQHLSIHFVCVITSYRHFFFAKCALLPWSQPHNQWRKNTVNSIDLNMSDHKTAYKCSVCRSVFDFNANPPFPHNPLYSFISVLLVFLFELTTFRSHSNFHRAIKMRTRSER